MHFILLSVILNSLARDRNHHYNLYFINYEIINIFSLSVYNYNDGEIYLTLLYTRCIRIRHILWSHT